MMMMIMVLAIQESSILPQTTATSRDTKRHYGIPFAL